MYSCTKSNKIKKTQPVEFGFKNWEYVQFKNAKEATDEYVKYSEALLKMIKTGFSAGVYTHTTDVEGEINGFMTYYRKVIKMEVQRVFEINQKICKSLSE